jgi:hypothetical protein
MKLDQHTAQQYLSALGYKVTKSTDFVTRLRSFQIQHGLNPSGQLDQHTIQRLVSKASGKVRKENAMFQESVVMPYSVEAFKVSTSFHAIVIITDESEDDINGCVRELNSRLSNHSWFLTVVHPGRQPKLDQVSAKDVSFVDYSDKWWSVGLNEALRQCRVKTTPVTIYPIMAKDRIQKDLVQKVWPLMETNNYLFVVCDWYCTRTMSVKSARKDSPLWEQCPIGSVLFNLSLVPVVSMNTMPVLQHNPDHATWIHWIVSGIKVNPLNWTVCAINRPSVDETEWTLFRSRLFNSWKKPKVSALMITGKNAERYPLARVSMGCFLDQTWSNKELVIINHGAEKVCKSPDSRIKEVFVTKGPGITLGDLRNWSIENASGDWCMTWDDDDWHHPTRMENQMANSREKHLSTFMWQVRCSLTNNCAFYDKMPTGQQMSVLYERSTPARYLSLEVREDTKFMDWFSERIICVDNSVSNVQCDPTQYIRFYHGRNIWDFGHMMNGSDGQYKPAQDKIDLTPFHSRLLEQVIAKFKNEDGFSISMTHPGPPK